MKIIGIRHVTSGPNKKQVTLASLVTDDGLIIIEGRLSLILDRIKKNGFRVEGINTPKSTRQ